MSINPEYVTELVQDKEQQKDWKELFQRMDDDYSIWNNEATETDTHDETMNITSPDPRSYADELQKGLVRSDRAINIHMGELKGSDEGDSMGRLERLLDFCFSRADFYLHNKGLISLKDSLVWYAMLRGSADVRILNDIRGNFVPDYMPLDPRWLTYDYGQDKLIWANYKTFRTKEDIKATYGQEVRDDIAEVLDFWQWNEKTQKATNAVVCEDKFLKSPKSYKMKRLPILVRPVGTRPIVVDKQGIRRAGFGDSIYSAARGLVPLINQILTLWATWANILANAPITYEAQEGQKELELFKGRLGAVIQVPPGGKPEAINLPEISSTLVNLLGHLLAMWQRATAPFVVFGDVKMPSSGTAISELKEAEEKAYFPYLTNLDTVYTDMCYMIEEQLLDGGLTLEVDSIGRDKKYYKDKIKPIDIKRPHVIDVVHTVRSKYGEYQAFQIAQMAKGLGIPDKIVYEKWLKFQDPDYIMDLADWEKVKNDPILLISRVIDFLIDMGMIEEASYLKGLGDKLGPQGPISVSQQPRTRSVVPGVPTAPVGEAETTRPVA